MVTASGFRARDAKPKCEARLEPLHGYEVEDVIRQEPDDQQGDHVRDVEHAERRYHPPEGGQDGLSHHVQPTVYGTQRRTWPDREPRQQCSHHEDEQVDISKGVKGMMKVRRQLLLHYCAPPIGKWRAIG
jgi:hypothetical protein